MLILLVAAAQAKPLIIQQQVEIDAPVPVVYNLLADVRQWDRWADIGSTSLKSATWQLTGTAFSPGQRINWRGGGMGAGSLRIRALEPDARVNFEVDRVSDSRGWAGRNQRVDVVLEPGIDGGTALSWSAELDTGFLDGLVRRRARLETAAQNALQKLSQVASAPGANMAPRELPEPTFTRRDVAAVWQGYHHRWSYNHRWNRHGNYVRPPECADDGVCTVEHLHGAASGTGLDRATFDSKLTWLAAPELTAVYGTSPLWVAGHEGETLKDESCTVVPDVSADAVVLLQGFDAVAVGGADSLWEFGLGVKGTHGDDGLTVCANARMRMACRTPECGIDSLATYRVPVHWLVIDAPGIAGATNKVLAHDEWSAKDLRDEPMPTPRQVALAGTPGDSSHIVGFSALSVSLESPAHTLGVDFFVGDGAADPETGNWAGSMDLFFKQWGAVEIAPLTVAQFAEAGTARLHAELVHLQVPGGCTMTNKSGGELLWLGGNREASGDDALHRSQLSFTPDACQ